MRRALRFVATFASLGYVVALVLFVAPTAWALPPLLVYAACPAALLTITVDPRFSTVALLLAPVNSILYAFGGLVSWLVYDEIRALSSKADTL